MKFETVFFVTTVARPSLHKSTRKKNLMHLMKKPSQASKCDEEHMLDAKVEDANFSYAESKCDDNGFVATFMKLDDSNLVLG